jgi:hypothetical protein
MRLFDLVRPYESEISAVIDGTAGEAGLRGQLRLPDGVTYERTDPDRVGIDASADALVLLGPVPGEACDVVSPVLAKLGPGALAIVLLEEPFAHVPWHRILAVLGNIGVQLLQVAPLESAGGRTGVLVAGGDGLRPPRDYFGERLPSDNDAEDAPATAHGSTVLRALNERVVFDLLLREADGRAQDAEDRVRAADKIVATMQAQIHATERARAAAVAEAERERRRADGAMRRAEAYKATLDRMNRHVAVRVGRGAARVVRRFTTRARPRA